MVRGWRGSLKPVSRANSQSRSDNDGIPPTPDSLGIPIRENHDSEYVCIARARFYIQALGFLEDYDLLLTPQLPLKAWGVDDSSAQNEGNPTPSNIDRLPFTYPFYPTGRPAASIPCGFATDVLPVALQIVGRYQADTLVLQPAAASEKSRLGHQIGLMYHRACRSNDGHYGLCNCDIHKLHK